MTKEEWIKIYNAKDGTWDKDVLIDKAYEIMTSLIKTNHERRNRNDYILLCQKVSVLEDKESKEEFTVLFDNIEYFPYYYSMMFDKKGNALNIAVLQDKKANSTTACRIEQIERKYKND